MKAWVYTAAYDYVQRSWDSRTGPSAATVTGNVSEIIRANREDEARALAARIAQRYADAGTPLRDERISESADPVSSPFTPPSGAADPRPTLTCRRCGTIGERGPYPFSTLPDSGLCDDCV